MLWKPGSEPAFPLDWEDSICFRTPSPHTGASWGSPLFGSEEMSVCRKHVWQPRCWKGPGKVACHITQWDWSVCARKTAEAKTLEEPRHCPYHRGGGLAVSPISFPSSKEESVPLQMVAQVHSFFLMSIPFIFLYYFSYFDQEYNKIPNKNSLKWGVFCLSIWGYKYTMWGGRGCGNMTWLVTLCAQSEGRGTNASAQPFPLSSGLLPLGRCHPCSGGFSFSSDSSLETHHT